MADSGEIVLCARCAQPVRGRGFATINGKRYCHGDHEWHDCYEQEQWDRAALSGSSGANDD